MDTCIAVFAALECGIASICGHATNEGILRGLLEFESHIQEAKFSCVDDN